MNEEPPEDWREREVKSDDELLPQEKEIRMVFSGNEDEGYISSEVPVIIRWIQSVKEAQPNWVRMDSKGQIMAISAQIPKGMVTLKSTSKKGQTNGNMVTYGPYHERDEAPEHLKEYY